MLPDPLSPDAASQDVNVIPLNFRIEFAPDRTKPGEFKEVHKVDLVKKGTNGESTPWSINELKKDRVIWPHIERHYEYWLKGQEEPVEGTPLDVLAFLPPSIVGHLKNIHIRTAEDLAESTDSALERIGMGARGWREKARSYLETNKDASLIASANAELKAANEALRKEIEELRVQVNSLVESKPRRGRPPKVPQ